MSHSCPLEMSHSWLCRITLQTIFCISHCRTQGLSFGQGLSCGHVHVPPTHTAAHAASHRATQPTRAPLHSTLQHTATSYSTCCNTQCRGNPAFYGVSTISRFLKIIRLFCKSALQNRLYSAKETYNLNEPTSRSDPTPYPVLSWV